MKKTKFKICPESIVLLPLIFFLEFFRSRPQSPLTSQRVIHASSHQVSQPVNQSVHSTIIKAIRHSFNKPIRHAIIIQPPTQLNSHFINHFNQSVSHSTHKLVTYSASQQIIPSVKHPQASSLSICLSPCVSGLQTRQCM